MACLDCTGGCSGAHKITAATVLAGASPAESLPVISKDFNALLNDLLCLEQTVDALILDGPIVSVTGCNVTEPTPGNIVIGSVQHDDTLIGTGCVGDPLSVAPAAGSVGYAEYVQHTAQAPIAPGTAIEYLTDNPTGVYNTLGITTTTGPGALGTAFQLPVGVYMVDYENSADAAWSLAIYQGVSNVVLTVDTNTIAGASTATTWIHGRAIITSAVGDDWIMVSPVTGTQAIPTAGTAAGEFIARITFLKLA